MRFFLDTEFNGYRGQLISLALVGDDGSEFYEVLRCRKPVDPWVAQHVIPILGKFPVADEAMLSRSLQAFLGRFDRVHIVVDWPDDIKYFCEVLVVGPGKCISTPPLTFEIRHDLPSTAETSELPHNALADARALAHWGKTHG